MKAALLLTTATALLLLSDVATAASDPLYRFATCVEGEADLTLKLLTQDMRENVREDDEAAKQLADRIFDHATGVCHQEMIEIIHSDGNYNALPEGFMSGVLAFAKADTLARVYKAAGI